MNPLRWGLIALALAGGMVGGAQFMEHILGLDPCPLCLMQRLWTMFGGAVVIDERDRLYCIERPEIGCFRRQRLGSG